MTGEPAPLQPQLAPLHVELPGGEIIAGSWLRGEGQLTVLFLHDHGADLDAVLPVMANIGLPEAHKLAVDLPGHGLSSASPTPVPVVEAFCDRLAGDGHGPLVVVGCGRSAELAWELGARPDVAAIALVSPILDGVSLPASMLRIPVVVFLAQASPSVVDAWQGLRSRLRARWLSVSMHATHAELTTGATACSRQVASHLSGFIREQMTSFRSRASESFAQRVPRSG